MPESFLHHPPSIDPEDHVEQLNARRFESYVENVPIEGESEKPKEFFAFFPIMEQALAGVQLEYGLASKTPTASEFSGRTYVDQPVVKHVDPERIHYLPQEVYGAPNDGVGESFGGYYVGEQSIHMLDRRPGLEASRLTPEQQRAVRLRALQHESLHMVSYEADYLGKDGVPKAYRQGYMVFNQRTGMVHFRGLNEAVLESKNMEVFRGLTPKLLEAFPGTQTKDWIGGQPIYEAYREVLLDIVRHIAQQSGGTVREVQDEFMCGLFTGKLLHLKEVDEIYGAGSLRLLAAMGALEGEGGAATMPQGADTAKWRGEVERLYMRYFSQPGQSWDERRAVAEKLLSPGEFARFCGSNGQHS